MTDKIVLTDLSNLQQQDSVVTAFNNNNNAIIEAINNTLSRDGHASNSMQAQLDMNSNRIINVGAPVGSNDAVRLLDLQAVNGDAAALSEAIGQAQAAQAASASSATAASASAASALSYVATATSEASTATTQATNAATSASSAASSLSSLLSANILSNTRHAISANYTLDVSDAGKTIALSGSCIKLSVAAASGFPAGYAVLILNESTSRGQVISIAGITDFILWPLQSLFLINQNSVWFTSPKNQRWRPQDGSLNFHVDPVSGSDSVDGLATGAGAFATIQHAVDTVRNWTDRISTQPVINLVDGTYNVGTGVTVNYQGAGTHNLAIVGNTTTPANVVIQCNAGGNCFWVRDGMATVTLEGMTLTTAGSGSALMRVDQFCVCDLNKVNFGAAPSGFHIFATTFASCNITSNYSVSGNAIAHIFCDQSYVNFGSFTVTGSAGLTFTTFLQCQHSGLINSGGVPMSFSGFSGVSGLQYEVTTNGVIESAGATYPGSSHSTSTGGQFI